MARYSARPLDARGCTACAHGLAQRQKPLVSVPASLRRGPARPRATDAAAGPRLATLYGTASSPPPRPTRPRRLAPAENGGRSALYPRRPQGQAARRQTPQRRAERSLDAPRLTRRPPLRGGPPAPYPSAGSSRSTPPYPRRTEAAVYPRRLPTPPDTHNCTKPHPQTQYPKSDLDTEPKNRKKTQAKPRLTSTMPYASRNTPDACISHQRGRGRLCLAD
jgi:hypothetical protein